MEYRLFGASDHDLLGQYLSLKYLVFVKELDWPLPPQDDSDAVQTDSFDNDSVFYGAVTDERLVGVCRCSQASIVFPYEPLFSPFVKKSGRPMSTFAVLTSFAFLKAYRGRLSRESYGTITHAHRLFLYLKDHAKSLGISTLLLSAGVDGSEKAFRRWGFQVISEIIEMKGAPIRIRNYAYDIPTP